MTYDAHDAAPSPDDPEDRKIITLATAARARTGAAQGACLRDADGRTYAATDVALPSLTLSAIAVTVAMAVSSGAAGVEAVAVTGARPGPADRSAVSDLAGAAVPIWVVDARGAVLRLTGTDSTDSTDSTDE